VSRHRLLRNIRVVRGVMRFAIEIQPRFDYGRKPHKLDITEDGVLFASDGLALTVHGIAPEGVSFTQHYDTEVLDSSLLMMPRQGFSAAVNLDRQLDHGPGAV
jgi:hypothetical protein